MPMTTPDWTVAEWLNSDGPLTLSDFQGRIVVLEAFQMLCPGCVAHGLPLLQQVQATFDPADVAVLGLHTVFEHHEAQGSRAALAAFLHEYRIRFPVGIDAQRNGSPLPATMADYEMQGTPTLVLFDREGQRVRQYFGQISALALGANIGALLVSSVESPESEPVDVSGAG